MDNSTQILDSFGRKHNYLRISLTDRCNHRCFYCMPEDGIELTEKENLMSIEEIIEIAKVFIEMGVTKIRLTGGEPLIRKNIEYLLFELGKLPLELAITSNAVLVDKFIDVFKQSGLKKINISLDSLDEDKALFITKRNFQNRILKNIDLLLQNNFEVKVNIVLIKGVNDSELIEFIEWSKDKNLSLRFIEFMPFLGNQWDLSKNVSLAEILKQVEAHYGDKLHKIKDAANDTSVNYKIEGFDSSFGIISSVTNPFCSTCNRIRLNANGTIKNCLFSNNETDLLTPFRKNQDIKPIILSSIFNKKKVRAGMNTLEDFSNPDLNSKNRSMISIGG